MGVVGKPSFPIGPEYVLVARPDSRDGLETYVHTQTGLPVVRCVESGLIWGPTWREIVEAAERAGVRG